MGPRRTLVQDLGPSHPPGATVRIFVRGTSMKAVPNLTLVHRFLLVGFCVLVAAMVFIGTWVGTQIESGIMKGMGVMTDLYLDGAISPHLQSLAAGRSLDAMDRIALDRKLASTQLGDHVVVLKI